MRALAILCAFGALTACSFHQTIAEHATNYNKTVAESSDEQVLLNVVRGSLRKPMHFTALTEFTGTLEQSANLNVGLDLPFGGDAASTYTLTPSVGISGASKPIFTVKVLETEQNFMNAVLAPVEIETVRYFIDQGWPVDLLVHLMVERVELYIGDTWPDGVEKDRWKKTPGKVAEADEDELLPPRLSEIEEFGRYCSDVEEKEDRTIIEPNPKDDSLRTCFAAIVEFLKDKLKIVVNRKGTIIGAPLSDPNNIDLLTKAQKEGLSFVKTGNDYRLCKIETETKFCVTAASCKPIVSAQDACRDQDAGRAEVAPESGNQSFLTDVKVKVGNVRFEKVPVVFVAHLRSLQGMLYYAGELMNLSAHQVPMVGADPVAEPCEGETAASAKSDKRLVPLFKVERDSSPAADAIAVTLGGKAYWVPTGDSCSRSMQTLTLFNQVFGIYQSRADLPQSTPTTLTINR